MKGDTRAQRNAIHYNPLILGEFDAVRGAWHESGEEVDAGLEWGRRKAALLRWVRVQMGWRLSRRERRCIELYYLEDLTYVEVGEREHCSPSSACRAVARALTKLRQAAAEDTSWRRHMHRGKRKSR